MVGIGKYIYWTINDVDGRAKVRLTQPEKKAEELALGIAFIICDACAKYIKLALFSC